MAGCHEVNVLSKHELTYQNVSGLFFVYLNLLALNRFVPGLVCIHTLYVESVKETFDTVNRNALWNIVRKLGCPDHFAKLLSALHIRMKTLVRFRGKLLEPLEIKKGMENPPPRTIYIDIDIHININDKEKNVNYLVSFFL